jgi:hypothetical protein
MSTPPFLIQQNIFTSHHPPILVSTYPCGSLNRSVLQAFLETAGNGVIGVAPAYGPKCVISVLAFASSSKILLVRLPKQKAKATKTSSAPGGVDTLQELVLCADFQKIAFNMDVLATSLFLDFGLRIRRAVDLLSVAQSDRHSLEARIESMGGVVGLEKLNVASLFKGEEKVSMTELKDVALQAWVAWRAATLVHMAVPLKEVSRIDTSVITATVRGVVRVYFTVE